MNFREHFKKHIMALVEPFIPLFLFGDSASSCTGFCCYEIYPAYKQGACNCSVKDCTDFLYQNSAPYYAGWSFRIVLLVNISGSMEKRSGA